ncbi:c-type cytochrome [Solirubrobacter phytolaccae]|uniref:C-type cytochrome n=1 Tax=Solirubrobacter phytolaccae TaxID=1404360 RepID=A0A9X3N4L5_9ACTN|nr:c-type cytochrome [Solirubrobacter phytolaccae]MDA0179534.1 c-type cytochrome [Solirubrobacter phytolaccae]
MHSDSRGSRRTILLLFFLSIVVLGGLVPAWVISSEANNKDIPSAQISGLTDEEKRGQELFGKRCSLCHTLKAANAVAKVGPNLDTLAPNEEFTLDAILKGRSNGNGQMPAELYTGQDAEDVAKFVAKSVGAAPPSGG